jgi:ribulose-phosphate 3-epimerase
MYEIIPSPGTSDLIWEGIDKKIQVIKPFAKTIHIDVCDGIFAPSVTFSDPAPFKKYTSEIYFEVHLMVEEPVKHLQKWADAGFKRFIGQIEKMSDQAEFVAQAQMLGQAALAVDGPTSLDQLAVSFEDLDAILFYTGDKAGYSGKPFQEDRLEKIEKVREQMPYLPIEADGGINDETIGWAFAKGVTRFVTTKFLFDMGDPGEQFKLLEVVLNKL